MLTIKTFLNNFILKPWELKDPKERKLAWAVSIILGVATGLIMHAGCSLVKYAIVPLAKKTGLIAKVDKLREDNITKQEPGTPSFTKQEQSKGEDLSSHTPPETTTPANVHQEPVIKEDTSIPTELPGQDQSEPPALSKNERIAKLREKYNSLMSVTTESSFVTPKRRVCGFGGMESAKTISRAKRDHFVTEEEIIDRHPMKFLPNSPFILEDDTCQKKFLEKLEDEDIWISIITSVEKQSQAIAITAGGKHIILQQAVKSCVPTCMAMLILDRGIQPNYEAVKTTSLANTERAIRWAKEAGLECRTTEIPNENAIELLSKCLSEKGPGMLAITHPVIGGHVVVLDEISTEKNEAVIRDPFHGWMITLKLDVLNSWLKGGDFLQLL